MAFTRSADGIAKQGKTKGKNLGDSGPQWARCPAARAKAAAKRTRT